jgi:hypothetical protein
MANTRSIALSVVLLQTAMLSWCAPARAADRPPQFVAIAFDNCTELDRWKELADFAAAVNKDGDRLHFTFFTSGVNLVADADRNIYEGPGQRRGYSRIGFGGTADDVRARVDYINELYRNGHEIASHAVGHFSGRGWSAGMWTTELKSFRDILDRVGPNNGLGGDVKFVFRASDVIGFRAPYLDHSPGLYAALRESGFRYDTSGDSAADGWPEKIYGIWRFNLARLRLHDSGRRTLSMDYNFFVAQSHAAVDLRRHDQFRDQVLQTYLDYFRANYSGNRAPLHIGHHFFDYQAGAYKEAMKAFALAVCGLPEVRCTTYAALADYLEQQSPATLTAYQKGDFPHATVPVMAGQQSAEAQPTTRH